MSLILEGKVWKFGDNISTDLMMPGFATSTRPDLTDKERAEYVMYSNRPGWVKQVKPGDIIVGGRNYGCGSSRNPSGALKALGISCVIAESMSRLFFRNSIGNGFPVMIAPGITDLCQEGDILHVSITAGEIKNMTTGKTMKVEPLSEDSPPMQILKDGGMLRLLEKEYNIEHDPSGLFDES